MTVSVVVLPLPVIPRISVWATSPLCRFKKYGVLLSVSSAARYRAEMRVRLLAGKDRKQKRQVGIVRVQQIQLPEVERIVARYGSEIGVQLVIGFGKEIAVRVGEDASKLGHKLI